MNCRNPLWLYQWVTVSVSDKVHTLQCMTLVKLTISSSYTADVKFIWRVKMRFTFPPRQIQNPMRFWWKQKQACPSPPGQIRCHSPPCLQQLKLKPLPCGSSITFPASCSACSRDAIACWAVFHEETSTLPVKRCFSLRVLIYSVWLWEIQLRGKWAPGLSQAGGICSMLKIIRF